MGLMGYILNVYKLVLADCAKIIYDECERVATYPKLVVLCHYLALGFLVDVERRYLTRSMFALKRVYSKFSL